MAALFFLFMMIGLIAILGSVFWIWMLVDCINNKRLSDTTKAVWVLIIVFTHFIGALCYLLVGRNQQQAQPYTPYQQPSAYQQSGRGMYQSGNAQYPLYQAPAPTPTQQGKAQGTPHTSYHQFAPEAFQQSVPYQQGYQPQASASTTPPPPIQEWRQEDAPQASYPEMPQQQSNFE